MRKLLLVAALALVALAASVTAASASTVTASPGGNITGTSLGTVTFADANFGISINCNVTLTGSLATRAEGTLPIANVGGITGGSTANCEGGSATILANATTNRWAMSSNSVSGGVATATFTGVKFLISIPFFSACLYTTRANASYSNSTGLMTITEIALVSSTYLSGFGCATAPTMEGVFAISPRQTIALS